MSFYSSSSQRPLADPEVRPYLAQLDRALENELKFRGCPQPTRPDAASTITSGMRDGSAHVLRCLKMWYDLPPDVFFGAVSAIDRFLTKMKAQPKHLSCIAVSAFHLSCRQHLPATAIPDPSDLVNISQSRCSPSDLLRMQGILSAKLDLAAVNGGADAVVTPLTLLRVLYAAARAAAKRLGGVLEELLPEAAPPDQMLHKLEILSCESLTLSYRPSEVALALLAADFQRRAAAAKQPTAASALTSLVAELQKYCAIAAGGSGGSGFVGCLSLVVGLLDRYHGEGTVAHRQRLIWKLSNRTLRHLRPTDKLRPTLPTIKEGRGGIVAAQRLRSNSECSEESMESLSSESDSDRDMDMEESE